MKMKKLICFLLIVTSLMCNVVVVSAEGETRDVFTNDDYTCMDDFLPEDRILPDENETEGLRGSNHPRTGENILNVNIVGLYNTDYNSDIENFFTISQLLTASEQVNASDYSVTFQGACNDSRYYYFAYTVKRFRNGDANNDTRVVCATKNDNGGFDIVKVTYGLKDSLGHACGMTYNSKNGCIIISGGNDSAKNIIVSVPASCFNTQSQAFSYEEHSIPGMATTIGYNTKKNVYVVGLTKKLHYFALLDSEFHLIKTFGDSKNYNSSTGDNQFDYIWNLQSLYSDENYIYSIQYKRNFSDGAPFIRSYLTENRIEVYDWNGNYKKTLYFNIDDGDNKNHVYEMESMTNIGDDVILVFNCFYSNATRRYCYYNLSKKSFTITYCPDENVSSYFGDTSKKTSFVVRNFTTKLYPISMYKSGYRFDGWTAYRKEVNKWYYKNGTDRAWYVEGQQPSGYTKYVYSDCQNVSATGTSGEHVYMCAQWVADNDFYVSFDSNGGSGTMTEQVIHHGTSTRLSSNAFTKTNCSFMGWNAYWEERDAWYYISTIDSDTGWYSEGTAPTGYVKYQYSNRQYVTKTVNKGSHVRMVAVWDETQVFYSENGKAINPSKLLESITIPMTNASSSTISKYTVASIHGNADSTNPIQFCGWYVRNLDNGKWCHYSGGNYSWSTSTSNRFLNTGSTLAIDFETYPRRIELVAVWSR